MLLSEMKQKSPVRILEKSIHGGLGKGNIGVFLSRPGVGKTACLIFLALDDIVREKKVLHFGVEKPVEKVRVWYDEISSNLVESFHVSDGIEIGELIEKNLIIMSFLNHSFSPEKMRLSIQNAVNQGKFTPHMAIVDGFDFEHASQNDVAQFKKIAEEFDLELWFSGRIHRENQAYNQRGVPIPYDSFEDLLSVIVLLEPIQDAIFLKLIKDHDNPNLTNLQIKLDPKTLLVKPRYT